MRQHGLTGRGTSARRLLQQFIGIVFIFALTLSPATVLASSPAWWIERGAIDPNKTADDYAAANLGQLKHFAVKAYDELQARLPGGAGPALDSLVQPWFQPDQTGTRDDYATVTLGQLKYVAKPFYDRLIGVGYTNQYPWSGSPDNSALAAIGQLKKVFSFDLAGFDLSNADADHDGINDSWEVTHGLSPFNSADAGEDFDGDGITNLQEFQAGTDPRDFYNCQRPTITIAGGDGQAVQPGVQFDEALVVLVVNPDGVPLQNAPIQFASSAVGIRLAEATGTVGYSLTVRTNAQGRATAVAIAPGVPGEVSITASAAAPGGAGAAPGGPSSSATFSALVGLPAEATFFVQSSSFGHFNPGFRQYPLDPEVPPLEIHWYLQETSTYIRRCESNDIIQRHSVSL